MELEHRILQRREAAIHYWIGGASNRPLVVFTHGATVDHQEWAPTVDLVGQRYRVLTWDVRSHGQSRPAQFSVDDCVADLAALLDEVGARQAILVGHSLGGNLHQEFAFRHPERICALVCVDAAWNFQRLSSLEQWLLRSARPIFQMYPYRLLVDQAVLAGSSTTAGRAVLRAAMAQLTQAEFITISVEMTKYLHHEPGFAIQKPLLLILGDKDATGNIRKTMPLWAEAEPDCRLVIVPKVTHSPNLDAPDIFHAELLQFLDQRVP